MEGLVNGPVGACQCEIAATGGARETIDPIDVGKIPGHAGHQERTRMPTGRQDGHGRAAQGIGVWLTSDVYRDHQPSRTSRCEGRCLNPCLPTVAEYVASSMQVSCWRRPVRLGANRT